MPVQEVIDPMQVTRDDVAATFRRAMAGSTTAKEIAQVQRTAAFFDKMAAELNDVNRTRSSHLAIIQDILHPEKIAVPVACPACGFIPLDS